MYNTQKGIALQFSDMYKLWQYAQKLTSKSIEVNTHTKTLICDCSEEEINLAITSFGAKILEGTLSKITS